MHTDTCKLFYVRVLTSLVTAQIVRGIDQYVRKRAFNIRPEVLRVFLGLRIKDVESLDAVIEAELTIKRKLTHKEKLVKKIVAKQLPKKSNKDAKVGFFFFF